MLSLVIIGASFIFVAGSIALKDFKDEKGDREHGKKTLLVKHGGRYVQRVILYCSVLAYVLLGLVSYYHSHSVLLVIVVVLATAANYRLLSSPNILTSSGVRATHGRRAKLLFFICVMVINVAILS